MNPNSKSYKLISQCFALFADYVTAFYVYRPSTHTSIVLNPVIFKNHFLNYGSNYNYNDGKFTASHDGIYYFAAQFRNFYRNNAVISVNLYHLNQAKHQRFVATTNARYGGSLQALVYLKSQDKVWIGAFSLEKILLDNYSYFIGFMLAKL